MNTPWTIPPPLVRWPRSLCDLLARPEWKGSTVEFFETPYSPKYRYLVGTSGCLALVRNPAAVTGLKYRVTHPSGAQVVWWGEVSTDKHSKDPDTVPVLDQHGRDMTPTQLVAYKIQRLAVGRW